MKLNGKLGVLLMSTLLLAATSGNAQIKIGGGKIKNPVKTDKPNVAVTKYDKAMKAGQKSEEDGNLQDAYKSYNEALQEKDGDYSAKSAVGRVEDDLKTQYFDQMDAANKAGECDKMIKIADESLALFEVWSQATYFKGQADDCASRADSNAEYEKNKLSDGDCEKLKADATKYFEEENWSKSLELLDKGYATKCITSSDTDYRGMQLGCQRLVQMEASKYTGEPGEDEGITNDVHKANVGKIVFSNVEIDKASPNTGSFKNSFSTSENLYGRVFLEKSLDNYGQSIGAQYTSSYYYRISVSGHTFSEMISDDYSIRLDGDGMEKWTSFQLGLNPNAADLKSYPYSEYNGMFWQHIYHLPEGSHDVKIEVVFDIPADEEATSAKPKEQCRLWTTKFGAEQVVAQGTFKINVKNADKGALSKKLCDPLPNAGALNSTTFNQQMIKLCTGKWDNQTPIKATVTSDAWNIHKDYLGNITDRTFNGVVVIKHEKENMYQILDVSFIQDYQGGGKYGALKYQAVAGGDFIGKELVK